MIAYLTGITSVAFLPALSWAGFLLAVLLLPALYPPWRIRVLLLAGGIVLASVYGYWQLGHRYQQPPQDVVLTAEVVDLPVYRNGYYSLMLRPLDLAEPLHRIRLIKASYYGEDKAFAQGDILLLDVRLKSPRGLSNPAAFDIERHYLSQGIDARGYIRRIIDHRPVASSLLLARQQIADWLDHHFEPLSAVTLRALVLGDRSRLSPEHWNSLRITGTAHLFVVSGLHVAVISALGWWIGRLLQLPALLLGMSSNPGHVLPPLLALLVAGGYAWLSGWGIPVQRAWLMLAVFMAASLLQLPLSGWQRWRLALVLVLTFQPLAVLEAGVWLSFGAVALILWLWQSRREQREGWARPLGVGLRVQLGLFIGMMPLMAANFNQLSLLSVPVNLIAVPVLSLLIWLLPLFLSASAGSSLLTGWVDDGVVLLWQWLDWCAQVPGLYTTLAAPSPISLLLAALAILLLLMPTPLMLRLLLIPVLVPLLALRDSQLAAGTYNVWIFDVGQGQAVLVETADGALLYDTGPGYSRGGAAFAFAIHPLLQAKGIRHLDHLVVSHGDSDHAGGLEQLSDHLSLGRIHAGEPQLHAGAEPCAPAGWQSAGVRFEFQQAFVPPQVGEASRLSANNRSCVLRIDNGHCSLLLTGDLDTSGEYRLLSAGYHQPVTWLVAGHHGSRDSTSAAILDWLTPDAVLISAGRHNRFGHPHAEVIQRLDQRGIPWLQTADSGAIKLVAEQGQCSIERFREQKKRYWTAS